MQSKALIGNAGVYFVVAELSRRGIVALPTVRNTAGYDIIASNSEGTKYANIQVKTSLSKVEFFPMPPSNKINDHETAYYVLARWLEKEKRFECFLLSGKEAKEEVTAEERIQMERINKGTRKKLFPSIPIVRQNEAKAKEWKESWENWYM